jgi:hypothetical protein
MTEKQVAASNQNIVLDNSGIEDEEAERPWLMPRELFTYSLYEDHHSSEVGEQLANGYICASWMTDVILQKVLDVIVTNEFRKRIPGNIVESVCSLVGMGMEMHFKRYDFDTEEDLLEIASADTEPVWSLNVARHPS